MFAAAIRFPFSALEPITFKLSVSRNLVNGKVTYTGDTGWTEAFRVSCAIVMQQNKWAGKESTTLEGFETQRGSMEEYIKYRHRAVLTIVQFFVFQAAVGFQPSKSQTFLFCVFCSQTPQMNLT